MVKSDTFNGRFKNIFNYEHFNLSKLALYKDNRVVTGRPLEFNFENTGLNVLAYHQLMRGTNVRNGDTGIDITRSDFNSGYSFFSFDLTPDMNSQCSSINQLENKGSLRLDLTFAKPLENSITIIFFFEYESLLTIDKQKVVT